MILCLLLLIFSNKEKSPIAVQILPDTEDTFVDNTLYRVEEAATEIGELAPVEDVTELDYNSYYMYADDKYNNVEVTYYIPTRRHLTDEMKEKIFLSDADAWSLVTNGKLNTYPSLPYANYKSMLTNLKEVNSTYINVKCWYWEDPNDDTNFNKVTVDKSFEVNAAIADIYEAIFADIYDDPSQPVINIADRGMGTWVVRSKVSGKTASAHAFGTAIDLNPSTGSYCVGNTTYGNSYKAKPMPEVMWRDLPESHKKYHVLYQNSPIVNIFKAYGFVWGGDWTDGTDCMHFSFLGDGNTERKKGIKNFNGE